MLSDPIYTWSLEQIHKNRGRGWWPGAGSKGTEFNRYAFSSTRWKDFGDGGDDGYTTLNILNITELYA